MRALRTKMDRIKIVVLDDTQKHLVSAHSGRFEGLKAVFIDTRRHSGWVEMTMSTHHHP